MSKRDERFDLEERAVLLARPRQLGRAEQENPADSTVRRQLTARRRALRTHEELVLRLAVARADLRVLDLLHGKANLDHGTPLDNLQHVCIAAVLVLVLTSDRLASALTRKLVRAGRFVGHQETIHQLLQVVLVLRQTKFASCLLADVLQDVHARGEAHHTDFDVHLLELEYGELDVARVAIGQA